MPPPALWRSGSREVREHPLFPQRRILGGLDTAEHLRCAHGQHFGPDPATGA
jgi:hypothetical protein